ncbi:1-phosphofructokinase family hexose kinase, partial [Deinococcus pimensis]|uniref:1-phosphofructokinase family hexose kinase n=1 Tax=Deinococcus pimensis TaxID=309888 RepID=UPI0005EB4904
MTRVVTVTLNPALDVTVRADGWRPGEVNAGQSLQWDAGGKGVNVASFLADHGLDVTVTGLLGDENPERFESLFRLKGIRDACLRVPGATRVGVKLVDGAVQTTTDINLPGLVASGDDLARIEGTLDALATDHDVFVLAGSLPPGPRADTYARLTARLHALGREVAVDTSGDALRAVLAADVLPDLLKPNVHELSSALGRPLTDERDVLAAARELTARGARLVAVSQGER